MDFCNNKVNLLDWITLVKGKLVCYMFQCYMDRKDYNTACTWLDKAHNAPNNIIEGSYEWVNHN